MPDAFLLSPLPDEGAREDIRSQLLGAGIDPDTADLVSETAIEAVDAAVKAFEESIDNALDIEIGWMANVIAAAVVKAEFNRRAAQIGQKARAWSDAFGYPVHDFKLHNQNLGTFIGPKKGTANVR